MNIHSPIHFNPKRRRTSALLAYSVTAAIRVSDDGRDNIVSGDPSYEPYLEKQVYEILL